MLRFFAWLLLLPEPPKRITAELMDLYGQVCALHGAIAVALLWGISHLFAVTLVGAIAFFRRDRQ